MKTLKEMESKYNYAPSADATFDEEGNVLEDIEPSHYVDDDGNKVAPLITYHV